MDVTFLLQGMQGREAVIGRAGQAEVEKGWVNGPSALPHPTACPSQKHKLTLIHMGLALGIVGTLARDTPSCLLAALQSGGWKATCLHRWIQDQLGL